MSYRPPRPPFYFAAEQKDATVAEAARRLLTFLVSQMEFFPDWRGEDDLQLRLQILAHAETDARIGLMWTQDEMAGHGVVALSVGADNWLVADLRLGPARVRRFWIEQAHEEIEFWPDGAISAASPLPEAPGRISKRGAWLQYRRDGAVVLSLEIGES